MNIIIVGAGKVGLTIAKYLSNEDNDVVIIDINLDVIQKANDYLDVISIRGNGLSVQILKEAGIETADLIIAATSRDEVNMLCCLTAKRLGAQYAIARIRDPEYSNELSMLRQQLGIDMIMNPDLLVAHEIARLIRFPTAMNVEDFGENKIEMVSFRVQANDKIVGKKIYQLANKQNHILYGILVRNDKEVLIPYGDLTIKQNDIVYLVGRPGDITQYFKDLGRYIQNLKSVMIIGASRICYYLLMILRKMHVKAKIIDRDHLACEHVNELFPECTVIHGDASDEDFLLSESITEMDAFVTLTNLDEQNLIMSLLGKYYKVPKVIAKVNHINYNRIFEKFGIESIVSPKDLTAYQIIRYVRALKNSIGSEMKTMYKLADDKAEALEFVANNSTKWLETPLKKLPLKKELLIAALVRQGQIIIPTGDDSIQMQDSVIIITKINHIMDLNDIYEDGGNNR